MTVPTARAGTSPLRAAHSATTPTAERLAELRAVARALWPDRDDPAVLSELVGIVAAIRQAEQTIGEPVA
jgi:hypothetical protein